MLLQMHVLAVHQVTLLLPHPCCRLRRSHPRPPLLPLHLRLKPVLLKALAGMEYFGNQSMMEEFNLVGHIIVKRCRVSFVSEGLCGDCPCEPRTADLDIADLRQDALHSVG